MSRALDLLLTAQQRSDCAKNDAAMGGPVSPIPFHADTLSPFSERELLQADLDYLNSKERRDAQRQQIALEQQVEHFQRLGWM